jgi:hypothetical protein
VFGLETKFVPVPESRVNLEDFSLFFVRSFSFVSLESLDSAVLNEIVCFRELVSFITLESLDFVALYEIWCFRELPEPFWFLEISVEGFGPYDKSAPHLCLGVVAGLRSESFSCSSSPVFGLENKFVPVPESRVNLEDFSLFFVRSFSFVSLESLDSAVLNEICCFRELVSFITSESLDFVALYEIWCFKELPEPFWFLENSVESLGPDDEFAPHLCS